MGKKQASASAYFFKQSPKKIVLFCQLTLDALFSLLFAHDALWVVQFLMCLKHGLFQSDPD
jgi:hypothetical protein